MILEVKDASKTIQGASILENINLTLSAGHVYGLQGPNGSGKTMLLRLIAGLIYPSSGEIRVDGKILGKQLDFPESIGILIENPAFLPNKTGVENLKLLASIRNCADMGNIRDAIARVGLNPDDSRKYRKYSLGMKQRLGIAAAIYEAPELILLDEPTNGLDEAGREQICGLLRKERERGALIVLASHDSAILETVSDEIYSISGGRIKELKRQ